MRYVAAYLLALLGNKENPSQTEVVKILSSVGIEVNEEKLKKVISELKGKNIEDVIAAGKEKLSSMPVGGAAAPAAAAAGAAAVVEEKKEDKKAAKEESEEEDEDMGFGLFD